jgi:formate hydrogenlyase transcriptional activator
LVQKAQTEFEQSRLARQEALFHVSRAINVYRNPGELFRVLANELRQVVDFDFVALFLYDEVANKIKNAFLETLGKSGFVIPSDFPAEETITWWVYHHQEPVLIASRDQEHRFPGMMELYKRSGVESACILPLTTAYRRLGSLSFGARYPNAYSSDETRYLSVVTEQVALAVDNALREEEQRRAELFLEEGQKVTQEAGCGTWAAARLNGRRNISEFSVSIRSTTSPPGLCSGAGYIPKTGHCWNKPSIERFMRREISNRNTGSSFLTEP